MDQLTTVDLMSRPLDKMDRLVRAKLFLVFLSRFSHLFLLSLTTINFSTLVPSMVNDLNIEY
jgi:hypothetical protein